MKTAAKLVIALALSWYAADRLGVTPMDGIQAMDDVKEQLKL